MDPSRAFLNGGFILIETAMTETYKEFRDSICACIKGREARDDQNMIQGQLTIAYGILLISVTSFITFAQILALVIVSSNYLFEAGRVTDGFIMFICFVSAPLQLWFTFRFFFPFLGIIIYLHRRSNWTPYLRPSDMAAAWKRLLLMMYNDLRRLWNIFHA
jgi:hypothetical protein